MGGTPFVPTGTLPFYITLDPALKRWAISKIPNRNLPAFLIQNESPKFVKTNSSVAISMKSRYG